MPGSTIRISKSAQGLLHEIARKEGTSMLAVLEKALREYHQKQFFDAVNQAYAALRKDPKKWHEEIEERKAWDTTLGDGLEDD